MANSARTLSLERAEEIIELQYTRKEGSQGLPFWARVQIADRSSEQAQAVELARIEELSPISIVPPDGLPGIVAVIQPTSWQDQLPPPISKASFSLRVQSTVEFVDGLISPRTVWV